jgi:N-methylhydantoinase A
VGVVRKPAMEPLGEGGADPSAAFRDKRSVYFASTGTVETATYDRTLLQPGDRVEGPALIEEHASTTVVHPHDVLTVDAFGNLHIEIRRS